ncbi:cyclic nucleotide-gated ion channel 1-like isoform X2 [Carya illinoinensis]|uniref:cyclic nucleotide-gated ion channel 1-like isoform X2 n=1 Tax=Carya illinoinensis TaxID=32201 RepID=UPI001C71F5D3|nr:cyclic nucleotide-gated ion channel 1-like isoform X2 [Carya illinoinensis]
MRSLVMRCFSFRKDEDIERQGPKNDGINGSEQEIKIIEMAIRLMVNPDDLMVKIPSITRLIYWNVILLVVCVVAVAVDPLFLYIPVINEATKCITIDNTLLVIAICVRSFLDLVACWDFLAGPIARSGYYNWVDRINNTLSILPVAQVLVPRISKMSGSKLRIIRKFLNAVVFLQYLPRIFRIYRLWKIVKTTILPKRNTGLIMVMKAGLNLYLYLVASHALGAFWYFFSIERETTCWQLACESDIGCSKSTSLNCEARKSGILASMDFLRKTMYCFWWGLRNLSSLGQNLETSSDYWENCFTVLISIFGLLLFLYFIGNLQVYMQWDASRELEDASKELEEISKQHHAISLPLLLPMLRKVPIFENESVNFLYEISKLSKQVQYNQNNYIVREGEPLDMMIFMVKGIVWTYTSNHGDKSGCLKKGDLFGEHLVEWLLESPGLSNIPLSTCTLKCHTKVEAFCLMAGDLQDMIISQYRWKFSNLKNTTWLV